MPAQTMDESLAEDWKAISEKYAAEEAETPPPEEPEQPAETPAEGELEQPAQAADKPRDESGKFVKGAKAPEKPAKEAKPEEAPEAAAAGPSKDRQRAPADLSRAPSSWKPLERADWGKIPESARAAILRREQDFLNGQQQFMPDAQFGRGIREVIAPYRMLIEAEGGTPERAVGDLLRTAAIFRVGTPQQKYGALAQIAQQFGLDLRVFGQQQGSPQAQPTQTLQDPRVDQLLAHQRAEETARQQREQAELESQVNGWMTQVDDQGAPKYTYLQDVIADMSALIPQIRQAQPHLTTAQVLEEGYKRAIWAHPEVRTLLQREAASERDAKSRADSQSRVRDARRAASVNVPRRASLPSPGKPGRIEDTIADKARELGLIT